MDVNIKHNGTDITQYVVEYKREQRICSGMGTITVNLVITYTPTIDTWDTIDLYESGNLVGNYFVGSIEKREPEGLLVVTCQDGSKRLTDYFIPDNYILDYPSNSKYWISKFLDEAGVDYTYTAAGNGATLSTNTGLGMASAYEQIVNLLQMSAWYMYFNGTQCIIGNLLGRPAHSADGVSNSDILNIKVVKSDKLMRNRAVVWGSGNPEDGSWVFADLRGKNKYTYDSNDIRSVVISNGTVASKFDATRLASLALGEFNKITVEKHLVVHGARDIKLGDLLDVDSNIFSGAGLVTTIGSSMSSAGLTTEIILDERCPRLFSFLSIKGPEYVYVSTYGNGVFRKPINDWVWSSYSTGLTNPYIVDLYKNNGILTCIDSSGIAYMSRESVGSWTPITLTGFLYNSTGSGIANEEYSGFYSAKAIIQDRNSNNIRIAVDSRSGEVAYEYYRSMDGYTPSGLNTSWVVDISPSNLGQYEDHLVSVSGINNVTILDIDNDGSNDYISVFVTGTGIITVSGGEPNLGTGSYIRKEGTSLGPYGYYPPFFSPNSGSYETFSGISITADINSDPIPTFSTFYVEDNFGSRLVASLEQDSYGFVPTLVVRRVTNGIIGVESTTNFTTTVPSNTYSRSPLDLRKIGNNYRFNYYDKPTAAGYSLRAFAVNIDPISGGSDSLLFEQACTHSSVTVIDDIAHFICLYYSGTDIKIKLYHLNLINGSYNDEPEITFVCPVGFTRTTDYTEGAHCRITNNNGTADWYVFYAEWEVKPSFTPEFGNVHLVVNGTDTLVHTEQFGLVDKIRIEDESFLEYRCNLKDYYVRMRAIYSASTSLGVTVDVYSDTTINVDLNRTGSYSSPVIRPYAAHSRTIFPLIFSSGTTPPKFYRATDFKTQANLTQITIPSETIRFVLPNLDSVDNTIYVIPTSLTPRIKGVSYNTLNLTKSFTEIINGDTNSGTQYRNIGNFIYKSWGASQGYLYYIDNLTGFSYTPSSFRVLRRMGDSFASLHQGIGADRVDVSNSFPVVAVESGIGTSTIIHNYATQYQEINQTDRIPDEFVHDFRYTTLVDNASGTSNNTLIYSVGSGVKQASILDTGEIDVDNSSFIYVGSGYVNVNQLETSNFQYPDQYMFISVSGDFFQKDPGSSGWWNYQPSGLPGSLITRIRVDDRF